MGYNEKISNKCMRVSISHQDFCLYFVSMTVYREETQGEREKWHATKVISWNVLSFLLSLSPPSGHLCVGFTLCSGPLRLCGSCSDGSVSLGLQPHREDPGGLSI